MRPSVLIVDDNAAFRHAAAALLRIGGFDVVGEAADGGQALKLAAALRPVLVLLDIQLPDLDGFAVADRLALTDDPPKVVLISSRTASVYAARVAESPVLGYIAKSDLSGEALAALIG